MTTIYKYTNRVNGKVYVGKTEYELKHRHFGHISKAMAGINTLFARAIRKYGMCSFDVEVLATVSDLGGFVEMLFIGALKANQPSYGYNLTDGGEGSVGFRHSEKSKESIRAKMRGRSVTDEFRRTVGRLKEGNTNSLGIKRSPAFCEAVRLRMRGNKNASKAGTEGLLREPA
jgi:group I intron endonuclease